MENMDFYQKQTRCASCPCNFLHLMTLAPWSQSLTLAPKNPLVSLNTGTAAPHLCPDTDSQFDHTYPWTVIFYIKVNYFPALSRSKSNCSSSLMLNQYPSHTPIPSVWNWDIVVRKQGITARHCHRVFYGNSIFRASRAILNYTFEGYVVHCGSAWGENCSLC